MNQESIDNECLYVFFHYLVVWILDSCAPPDPVSGGGTLYMKWGAGLNSESRTQQREQVEKHTPTFTFNISNFLTNHNFTLSAYAHKFSQNKIIKNTLKKKAKIL
jgi:hypothetical protein